MTSCKNDTWALSRMSFHKLATWRYSVSVETADEIHTTRYRVRNESANNWIHSIEQLTVQFWALELKLCFEPEANQCKPSWHHNLNPLSLTTSASNRLTISTSLRMCSIRLAKPYLQITIQSFMALNLLLKAIYQSL